MSGIKWLSCPKCAFRFYIISEHADQGFDWFCPRCKHEFREDQQGQGAAAGRPAASGMH